MSTAELQYRLLYSMVVAGKSAKFADAVLRRLFKYEPPFEAIRRWKQVGIIEAELRKARSGNYAKLARGFAELAESKINLRKCTPADLEEIHGVGPKTSRFFILWTRPGAEHAALDTHVLKWLRYIGHDAPKSTPSGDKYAALEKVFISAARARGMTPRELDSAIWDWCSSGNYFDGVWPEKLRRHVA
ncbi:MAG: hypothetical protein C0518_05390 [Opitutus sp.]|nr:hypothetical protein [Opitutus sp.]